MTHTVTFAGEDISIAPLENIAHGSKITAPAAPERTGYTFNGWFAEETFENEWDFEEAVVTQDITLWAQWTATTGIGDVLADGRTITGYYSIMGVKLPDEPARGVYIVTYDNGTAEKRIK
jgi:uncharacterized repeat protein (TIGR02543 family)